MPKLLQKRGTRAQIEAAKTANQLNAGEIYIITDESKLAFGLSANTYAEAGAGTGGGATALSFSYVDGELIVTPNDLYSFALTDGELIITYTGQG